MPTTPTPQPLPKKPKKPWRSFWLIIAITLFTALYNIPSITVNWNLFGQNIEKIGGYDLCIPSWDFSNNRAQCPTLRQMDAKLGLDLQGGVQLTLDTDMSKIPEQDREQALNSARTIIERRVNLYGVSEPIVQASRNGEQYRIIVELAGVQDVDQALNLVGRTAQLEFRVPLEPTEEAPVREEVRKEIIAQYPEYATLSAQLSSPPPSPAPSPQNTPEGSPSPTNTPDPQLAFLSQLEEFLFSQRAYKQTDLTGKDLRRASVTYGQNTAGPTVNIEFNDEGARKFGELTQRYVGRSIAIFLDDQLISAPNVQEPIFGGQAVISGGFTSQQAKDLATQLNAGALPVPVNVVEQRTVGASLGQESVNASVIAGSVGLGLVMLYMMIYYRVKGIIAAFALILYTLISLTIFRMIPVTLTLAGIAGFILSIGMAIDANILIFERIKEEIKWGKSKTAALRLGFERAWSSIYDSNIASLITCGLLYFFGTGLVRGFAVTLAIGILVSMFTAITVTKTLLLMVTKNVQN